MAQSSLASNPRTAHTGLIPGGQAALPACGVAVFLEGLEKTMSNFVGGNPYIQLPKRYPDSDEGHLACPKCGDQWLHHGSVLVCQPSKEDSATGLCVDISGTTLTSSNEITGNPSARRNGLRIRFWCEMCAAKPVLNIAQHKGCTQVWWDEQE